MSQAPESRSESPPVAEAPRADVPAHDDGQYGRPTRLNQALAWVGIIAGVLFVVAVIFFSGYFLSWSSGSHCGLHRGDHSGQTGPGDTMGSCPMMGQGEMMGPGHMVPGAMMPGGPTGPDGPTTTSAVPSTPRPDRRADLLTATPAAGPNSPLSTTTLTLKRLQWY